MNFLEALFRKQTEFLILNLKNSNNFDDLNKQLISNYKSIILIKEKDFILTKEIFYQSIKEISLINFINYFYDKLYRDTDNNIVKYNIQENSTLCMKYKDLFIGLTIIKNKENFIVSNSENILCISNRNNNFSDFQIIFNFFKF